MQHAQIAQLVEQRTENPCVAGSIPALGTFLLPKLHNENDGLPQMYICGSFLFIAFDETYMHQNSMSLCNRHYTLISCFSNVGSLIKLKLT